MTLQDRLAKAKELREAGYNCAQTLVASFTDKTGLTDETTFRVCNALGSGVAASGEICGVVNGMAIVIGLLHGNSPADKITATREMQPLIQEFKDGNDGRLRCADLKGVKGIRPCNELIFQGIEILHNHLSKQ